MLVSGIAEYPTRIGCPGQKESLYLLPGINLLNTNISTRRSSCRSPISNGVTSAEHGSESTARAVDWASKACEFLVFIP